MVTYDDYVLGINDLLRYISDNPDVKDVWKYGQISEPGVSDLDLIAVTSSRPQTEISSFLSSEKLPHTTRVAMAHANLIVVSEDSAQGVFFWDDLKCTSLKTGKNIVEARTPQLEKKYAMLIDWFFERCFRLLEYRMAEGSSQIRFLGTCKSFLYSLGIFCSLSQLSEAKNEYLKGKKHLDKVRSCWLAMSHSERGDAIVRTYEQFSNSALTTHQLVFRWLEESFMLPCEMDHVTDLGFVFPDGNSYIFLDEYVSPYSADNHWVVPLPNTLLAHFRKYTTFDSALGKKLLNSFTKPDLLNIGPSCDEAAAYLDLLESRIAYASMWYDYLKTHRFKSGLFKLGWYLNDG